MPCCVERTIAGLLFVATTVASTQQRLIAVANSTAVYPGWIKNSGMAVTVEVDARLRADGTEGESGRPTGGIQQRSLVELKSAALAAAQTWKFADLSGQLPEAVAIVFDFDD